MDISDVGVGQSLTVLIEALHPYRYGFPFLGSHNRLTWSCLKGLPRRIGVSQLDLIFFQNFDCLHKSGHEFFNID